MKLSDLDVYERICIPRFAAIEANQKELTDDIHAIREKLFNGFSERMDKMGESVDKMNEREENRKRSRALIIRDVLLAVIGGGGILSLIIEKLL